MLPDVIVHKSNMSVDDGGGGKDKKVSVNGASKNKSRLTIDREGMETLLRVVLTVGRKCSGMVGILGS